MKKLFIVLGSVVAIAMLIVALRTPATSPVAPANASEVATAPAAVPAPTTAVPDPVMAPAPTVPAPLASAAPAPLANDPFARRDEIEAAAARGDVSALPELLKTDLAENGYVAAAAIDAVGKLAALAPEKEKREAVRTLGNWLQQESKRKALGNVSIVVDALQDTKSDAAIAPLVAALDSAAQPLHIETRIVEALTSLNATTAVGSVERWVGRLKALNPQDDFEKELAAEALVAADTALKKWRP
jgi:hypothetical protein